MGSVEDAWRTNHEIDILEINILDSTARLPWKYALLLNLRLEPELHDGT